MYPYYVKTFKSYMSLGPIITNLMTPFSFNQFNNLGDTVKHTTAHSLP